MTAKRIAVIPGDGVGREVVPACLRVLDAVGVDLDLTHFDWSCERYHSRGERIPAKGIDQLRSFDAILLGAVGYPGIPDHVSRWVC